MTSKDIAQKFVKIMDSEDYEPARTYLAKDCRYIVGETIYLGPDAIVETYKSHHNFAKSKFDSVLYSSELSQKSASKFEVIYLDIITHGSKTHTYKCKQIFCMNSENKVIEILHEDIPGEYDRLKTFYMEIGLSKSE